MNQNWQALPQRRKRNRQQDIVESQSGENCPSSTSFSFHDDNSDGEINANIRARSQAANSKAKATLAGKDGVAGDFYEYLDHTADVQLHAWGESLEAAFSNIALCMFNYMTDLDCVAVMPEKSIPVVVSGHDLQSLLFGYLDELLFRFCTDGFLCKRIDVHDLDLKTFRLSATAHGETFNPSKHPQGTEIKAITYSNMQIHQKSNRIDLYVIVDI